MTESKIKHFEQLWEESEKLVSDVHKDLSSEYILDQIQVLLENYKDLLTNKAIPIEIAKTLKHRYVGEIVFFLTAISAREDINVYASLMEEIKLNRV